jgi:hypothetical protein
LLIFLISALLTLREHMIIFTEIPLGYTICIDY